MCECVPFPYVDDVSIHPTIGPYDEYVKGGGSSPPAASCAQEDIKATSYVNFGKSTVVVIASWCADEGVATVTLDIDWTAIGLNAAGAKVTAPAVDGVQAAADYGKGDGKLTIKNIVNGGVMLVITN